MYVHLSEAALHDSSVDPVARLERDDGLVWVGQVRAWCGRPDTQVIVKPVIDLDACKESTSDQVPEPIKEKVALRDRTCVFPWCTRPARNCHPGDPDRHPGDPTGIPATATTSSPAAATVPRVPATSHPCVDGNPDRVRPFGSPRPPET
jgi:hypothetical protein